MIRQTIFILVLLCAVSYFSWVFVSGNNIFSRQEDEEDIEFLNDQNIHIRNVEQSSWNVERLPRTYFDTPIITRSKRSVEDGGENSIEDLSLPKKDVEKNSRQQLPTEESHGCSYVHVKPTAAYRSSSSQRLYTPQNCMQLWIDPDGIAHVYPMYPQAQAQPQPQQNVGNWPVLDASPTASQFPSGMSDPPRQRLCFWVDPTSGQARPMSGPEIPNSPTFQFPAVSGIAKSVDEDDDEKGDNEKGDDEKRDDEKGDDEKEDDEKGDAVVGSAQTENPYDREFGELMRECPVNFYRCGDGSRCISRLQWCDNLIDCPDGSDETKCSCRDRIGKARLCDNYIDCPHGEDELGCFGCPKNSFSCSEPWDPENDQLDNKSGCVSLEQRCDGIRQCHNGKDERDCSVLAPSVNPGNGEMYPVSFGAGFLQRNLRGRWYPVCGYAYSWANDACAGELGQMREDPTIHMIPTTDHLAFGPYLEENDIGAQLVSQCPEQVAYVHCPRPAFGQRHGGKQASDPKPHPLVGASSPRQRNSTGDPIVSIVGGKPSSPRAWPFVLSITRDGVFHCGAVVLNELWLLTAAHCFTDMENHYYEVSAGLLRRSSFAPSQQLRHLTGVAIHPHFNSMILQNDVALGLLNEPLLFNSWVRPVKLPQADVGFSGWAHAAEPRPGTTCTAVGWGTTVEGGSNPDELREVEIPVIGCKYREDRNSGEICAGFIQGGKDACQGDSGGPLMCRVSGSRNEWYVGGIVSHGIGCGRQNEPGAYTKVSHYVDWINSVMKSRSRGVAVPLTHPRSQCPGFSCAYPRNRCLQAKRRCDRVTDCLGAEDEAGCPASLASHPLPRDSLADPDPQKQESEVQEVSTTTQETLTEDAETPEAVIQTEATALKCPYHDRFS